MVQKQVTQQKATKTILLSHISNNCSQTNLIVLHNLCSICPTPVHTHVLSLFVKFLMALLMGSRGKSSHINSNATFTSLLLSCWLWLQIVVCLEHSSPHLIIHFVQIRRVWGPFVLLNETRAVDNWANLVRAEQFALVRHLAERWIQLAADTCNLKLILKLTLEADDQRPICSTTLAFSSTKCSQPLPPKQTPAETITCEVNFSRWTIKRSGLTVTCSYAGTLFLFCVGTGGGHVEHKLWSNSNIKFVW